MIVADNGNRRVVILDQDGSWLLNMNSKDFNFLSPNSLALDPQGNVHVTADRSDTIKVVTPEGTYVRSYGDVYKPTGIAIDEEGYSLVCEQNCLSIFDPQGKMIHKVETTSGSSGGVALDPISGSLYVATRVVWKYSVNC